MVNDSTTLGTLCILGLFDGCWWNLFILTMIKAFNQCRRPSCTSSESYRGDRVQFLSLPLFLERWNSWQIDKQQATEKRKTGVRLPAHFLMLNPKCERETDWTYWETGEEGSSFSLSLSPSSSLTLICSIPLRWILYWRFIEVCYRLSLRLYEGSQIPRTCLMCLIYRDVLVSDWRFFHHLNHREGAF